MKSRFVLSAIVLVLLASSVSAQGLVPSPSLAASIAAAAAPPLIMETKRRNAELYWSGLALSGAGGFLLGYALSMPHDVTCISLGSFITCQETGANRGVMIGVGAATIGAGFTLAAYGGKRVAVAPTRNGIVGRLRF